MYRFKICVIACASVLLSGAVQAQAPQQPTAGRPGARTAITRGTAPSVLPGTSERAFTTIQGTALDSASRQMPNAVVRLRDARLGGIVDTQVTDRAGLFAFHAINPGSYVVELVANEQTILAASDVLNVNAGDVASAVVRLPFRIPPFAGILGQSGPQAAAIISAAVASGVLAADAIGDDVSPE